MVQMWTNYGDKVYQDIYIVPQRVLEKRAYKICLYGEGAVGKTSLIQRYVKSTFDEKYIMTIGTTVSGKKVVLPHPKEKDAGIEVNLQIWDIMGQMGFSELLKEKHFSGARAAIGVCDITRASTLVDLEEWTESLQKTVGKIPVILLANKCDLADKAQFGEKELYKLAQKYKAVHGFASARTGENVDLTFRLISEALIV
jgi:small GTP-binding protein